MAQVVVLVPAHNEADSIAETISALLKQDRIPDKIVVIPNGCDDETANIARSFESQDVPLTVLELPKLEHKKSEALNRAWCIYGRNADVVVCLDADTILPPNAIGDWEKEMESDETLGGSSSKFTMLGGNFWTRLQRSEFAAWTDTALRRGYTTVLAGTGCAIRGAALCEVVEKTKRVGPWSYDSQVEDFELTYEIRKTGYRCQVSPTVRAYTDSMKNLKALWGQRMKWQVGTVEDLLNIGFNRYTRIDWWQQTVGLMMAFVRMVWFTVITLQVTTGVFHFQWLWWLAVPAVFALGQGMMAWRIPHKDRWDIVMAFAVIPSEIFATVRSAWFVAAWLEVMKSRVTGNRKDRWALQYKAESVRQIGGATHA